MKKKIGCVIAYKKNHTNYGTSLVGYALLKKIQQLGYDIEVVNYIKQYSISEKIHIGLSQFRVHGWKFLKRRLSSKPHNINYLKGIENRTKAVEKYKEKKLYPLFRDYYGYEALKQGSRNYDAVVVGSDQVWLPGGLKSGFFNLLFVDENIRKIAYASSFGVSEIPSFQRKETGKYLDRFYRIGVREESGKKIVESLSTKKAQVVADPTLLLTSEEWTEEIRDSKVNTSTPYIFCYFLGTNPEARAAANELKEKTGFKIITLRHMDEFIETDEKFGDEAPYNVNPEDFVKYIKEAEYILTDSFHCSAFSIQFHKRFMTFYRFAIGKKGGRNSRIDSLFSVLQIPQDRIYKGDIAKISSKIDWDSVDNSLNLFRQESINYLREALK